MKVVCHRCFNEVEVGRRATKCPYTYADGTQCGYEWPHGAAELRSPIIAVIGPTTCGKSVYMTVLAHRLREVLCRDSDVFLNCEPRGSTLVSWEEARMPMFFEETRLTNRAGEVRSVHVLPGRNIAWAALRQGQGPGLTSPSGGPPKEPPNPAVTRMSASRENQMKGSRMAGTAVRPPSAGSGGGAGDTAAGRRKTDPWVFELCVRNYVPGFYNLPRRRIVNLVFFDPAGEELSDPVTLAQFYGYLRHAGAFVVLVDPLQLASVAQRLPTAVQRSTRKLMAAQTAHATLAAVMDEYRKACGLSREDQIRVPAAITLTKIDELCCKAAEGEDTAADYRRELESGYADDRLRHRCGYHRDAQAQWAGSVRRFLVNADNSLVTSVQKHFRDHMFFGVSSLGKRPEKEFFLEPGEEVNYVTKPPVPIRVEDPLIWILWRMGYIPERYDMGKRS